MACPRQAPWCTPISPRFSCILPFPQRMKTFNQYNVRLQSAKGVLHLSQRANRKSCLYTCKCERRHSGTKKKKIEKSSISLFSVFAKSIYKQNTGFKTCFPSELECHPQLFICHLRMAIIWFFYFFNFENLLSSILQIISLEKGILFWPSLLLLFWL